MPRKDFRAVRNKFARDDGLPFGRLLPRDYVLGVLESEGHSYRARVFDPLTTLWGWLSQSLSQDKSLNEVVSRVLAHRVAAGLPIISASSSSYSDARSRFPGEAMKRMAREIGRKVHESADDAWLWHGRQVFLCDGTGLSMPDTVENQLAYPQADQSRRGLGFPLLRAVALISLSTGAVVDFAFGRSEGKGTGEGNLLHSIAGSITPGSVLVADKYYPSYKTIVMLQRRGVDLVSISHASRKVDFSAGEQLGSKDHIVEWVRPTHKRNIWPEGLADTPERIAVREFEIDIINRNGKHEKAIVVSTITDPSVPQQELSDLYLKRWNAELDLRSIKQSMHLDVLRCKTPEMIAKEIWCHLLAYNLLRGVMTESAKRNAVEPRQLSVKGAMQAVESFTAPMMAIDGNEAIYHALLGTIAAHRVANRPGRLEPRLKKRRHAWKHYMMKPRDQYHRRLTADSLS
jgi:Transposase DDE domain